MKTEAILLSDVYARWAEMMGRGGRGSGGADLGGWCFGEVLDAGQGRLRVVCLGLTLEPEDLRLPPGLSYTWEIDTGGDNLLRRGDRLLVLVTADRQDYYVLEKSPW